MNKDGNVANYKHHDKAETKDIKESNTHDQHQKGNHPGEPQHPDKGTHLKNIHQKGSDHHKGNLAAHGQHSEMFGSQHKTGGKGEGSKYEEAHESVAEARREGDKR